MLSSNHRLPCAPPTYPKTPHRSPWTHRSMPQPSSALSPAHTCTTMSERSSTRQSWRHTSRFFSKGVSTRCSSYSRMRVSSTLRALTEPRELPQQPARQPTNHRDTPTRRGRRGPPQPNPPAPGPPGRGATRRRKSAPWRPARQEKCWGTRPAGAAAAACSSEAKQSGIQGAALWDWKPGSTAGPWSRGSSSSNCQASGRVQARTPDPHRGGPPAVGPHLCRCLSSAARRSASRRARSIGSTAPVLITITCCFSALKSRPASEACGSEE